ncbi:MAG: hypothetical protein IKM27_01350 [Clostridia bacterium]|nr:hypothetical protein [Clostridia bacterium]
MTREDAYYQMLLLKCGITDVFNSWFNDLLENEEPLSKETMGLIDKSDDINAVISYLEQLCGCDRDEHEACRRVRLFLRDEYTAGRLTNARCAEIMYTVSVYNRGFENPIWEDMYYLSDVYDYAEIGVCTMENFEELFKRYLETGEYLKTLKY